MVERCSHFNNWKCQNVLVNESVQFIDKSLSAHCHLRNSCATDLKVLTQENGIFANKTVKQRFLKAYREDVEMSKVDIVMCFHPSAMCELFLPLDKRIFVIATTRYEMGRKVLTNGIGGTTIWWRIASDPKNLVAANNLYDAKYIEHFTGIRPVLFPSWVEMGERCQRIVSRRSSLHAHVACKR